MDVLTTWRVCGLELGDIMRQCYQRAEWCLQCQGVTAVEYHAEARISEWKERKRVSE